MKPGQWSGILPIQPSDVLFSQKKWLHTRTFVSDESLFQENPQIAWCSDWFSRYQIFRHQWTPRPMCYSRALLSSKCGVLGKKSLALISFDSAQRSTQMVCFCDNHMIVVFNTEGSSFFSISKDQMCCSQMSYPWPVYCHSHEDTPRISQLNSLLLRLTADRS
jgi:hypothetical protein